MLIERGHGVGPLSTSLKIGGIGIGGVFRKRNADMGMTMGVAVLYSYV